MSGTPSQPSKIVPNYESFVIGCLARIFNSWDAEDYTSAIYQAMMLAHFLPPKDWIKIEPETTRIENELRQAEQMRAGNFHTTRVWQGKSANTVAFQNLPSYTRSLMTILAEGGYVHFASGVSTRETGLGNLDKRLNR